MTIPSPGPNMDVDIVCVGSGMGASCAALAAQAQGLESVILEKSDGLRIPTELFGWAEIT